MITTLLCTALAMGGSDINTRLLGEIPHRMGEFVSAGKIAGAVTLVAANGKIIEIDATGYRDLETKAPMKEDSIFQVMSMTKPVTATAVMMLIEEGRISLRTPIDQILPEFKTLQYNGKHVAPSVQQVLSHVAGFDSDSPNGMTDEDRASMTLGDFVKKVAQVPLLTEPGSNYRYSGVGYAVLGRIVEVVSGKNLEDFFQERIFRPLKMKDTSLFIQKENVGRLASVYLYDKGKMAKLPGDPARPGAKFAGPAGGLYSTARDMWAFFQCLGNYGEFGGVRILSTAAVETMSTSFTGNMLTGSTDASGYGLGLIINKSPSSTLNLNAIGSFGHSGAMGTQGWINPKRHLVGIYMAQILGNEDAKNAFMAMANASVDN